MNRTSSSPNLFIPLFIALACAPIQLSAQDAAAQTTGATPVPDLTRLLSPRESEMGMVIRRYQADRGSLNGFYSLSAAVSGAGGGGGGGRRGGDAGATNQTPTGEVTLTNNNSLAQIDLAEPGGGAARRGGGRGDGVGAGGRGAGGRGGGGRGGGNDVYVPPAKFPRMMRFYTEWQTAVKKIDVSKLSELARPDVKTLLDEIQADIDRLGVQAAAQAEIEPVLPFASVIVGLTEDQLKFKKPDSEKVAGKVEDLAKQITQARIEVEAGKLKVSAPIARRAADAANAMRNTLRNYFDFYNRYDPMFSWWMPVPYREADQALNSYVTLLREKGGSADAADTSPAPRPVKITPLAAGKGKEPYAWTYKNKTYTVPSVPSESGDVPDLKELMAFPQSEMRGVLQAFSGGGGGGRGGGGRRGGGGGGGRNAEEWLTALGKLDFDSMSRPAQVDYLLMRNRLQTQQAEQARRQSAPQQEQRAVSRGPAQRDGSDIIGNPVGREELMTLLKGEMIAYTPEELIERGQKEYDWCVSEMKKASREMGFGDDWKKALEVVKEDHAPAGDQPYLIAFLMHEAVDYISRRDMITVPVVANEVLKMEMMSPQRQLVNPFFTGGATISVSFPVESMAHDVKEQSMRGNNNHFARSTVFHEMIPGHNFQGFNSSRFGGGRGGGTPFWGEGWACYWELLLYKDKFPKTPENRIGMLFWRMHRCARIVFSLKFHMGQWTPKQCIDFLVDGVGHERDNATAEVRRSFTTTYGPLYQAAYLLGALQFLDLHKELVESGKMKEREFHDTIIRNGPMPVDMVRASLTKDKLSRDYKVSWRF